MMLNAEPQPDVVGTPERERLIHDAAVSAFTILYKGKARPGSPLPEDLNTSIRSGFGLSEIEAQKAIRYANEALADLIQNSVADDAFSEMTKDKDE